MEKSRADDGCYADCDCAGDGGSGVNWASVICGAWATGK